MEQVSSKLIKAPSSFIVRTSKAPVSALKTSTSKGKEIPLIYKSSVILTNMSINPSTPCTVTSVPVL